ncbi:hypothetical protein HerbRD11066_40050 [Herbidospora sp. RD11066]
MSQQFLDTAEIGAALQKVSGGRVTEPVRTHVRHPRLVQSSVNDPPHRALFDPPALHTEEERGTGSRAYEDGAPTYTPGIDGVQRRHPQRHDPLPATFTEDSDRPALPVDVVQVESAEFTDPDSGGVENLEQGLVP